MQWNKLSQQQKKQIAFKRLLNTKPYVWIITMSIWTISLSLLTFFLIKNMASNTKVYESILQISYLICAAFFLFHVTFELVRIVGLFLTDKKFKNFYEVVKNINIDNEKPKVLILYCTFNDFSKKALEKTIQQNYDNFEVIILDDSTNDAYKKAVDNFAKQNKIEVVRRPNRKNFKAGALNDYLLKTRAKDSYDFFVVIDSDDVLPANYIVESLKCFHINEKIGAVQAAHVSMSNRNLFMKIFSILQTGFAFIDRKGRTRFGSLFEIGHGVMFKKQAYEFVGGFPENVLLEDVAISFEMMKKNLKIFYAQHVICGEESPVDFISHKKRASKWARGDIGLLKRYFFKMLFSRKIKLHEKLDIIRAPFLTSIVSIFMVFIIITTVASAILNVQLFVDKILWSIFIIPVFYPFLISLYVFRFHKKIFKSFFGILICIFISTASFTTLFLSSFFGFFNKKIVYNVTPKEDRKITFWMAIKINILELILGFGIVAFIIFSLIKFGVTLESFGILSVLSSCMIFSPVICFMSNIIYSNEVIEKINQEIIQSIKINN